MLAAVLNTAGAVPANVPVADWVVAAGAAARGAAYDPAGAADTVTVPVDTAAVEEVDPSTGAAVLLEHPTNIAVIATVITSVFIFYFPLFNNFIY